MNAVIVKGYVPGAIGRIAELHAAYYSREAGFGLYFEAKVATELAEFLGRFSDGRDGIWLLTCGGRVEGSIAVDGAEADTRGAHLRWFILSDALRGRGLGNALIAAAVDFCRKKRYKGAYLWTFEGLDAARHLYEKHGFRLTCRQRGNQWGKEVTEQRFELAMKEDP
jgi:GNAT superfamily N-acetyltransferase